MYDLHSYTEMLINKDMLAFHFWVRYTRSLFKWTMIIKVKQNVHWLTVFDIANLS